ncbi:MAG: class I SAM-dependent rRNA methyltransferase [Acidobacteria bacterium]|nr:class I SAM-dependent rRNA methyltransferase [Acidobacteriota bacterium]
MSRVPPTVVVSRHGTDRVRAGHPWIYRSDVVEAHAEPGDLVRVLADRRRVLGWGFWSSRSQIAVRLLTAGTEPPDERALFATRIRRAAEYRAALGIDATAWRLVHAEADLLPSLVVDRYANDDGTWFVVQTLSQATDRRLSMVTGVLVEQFGPRGVLARNDPRVRALEGLAETVEVAYGDVPDRIAIREGEITLHVAPRSGQKTGLFLDQRENHRAAAEYARGRVLDAFCYQGGFALQMARRAEQVLAIDSSAAAVAATREQARLNGLENVEAREANVFDELRELASSGREFDAIVLDPPAFAKNRASVDRAVAGYKEINLRAMHLLAPGGHLITCSCSYNVDEPLFLGVLQQAAADARRAMTVVEKRMQARDHPVLLTVPETYYLKCIVLRRVE